MTDRFDLEQQIMNCWSIVDDLLPLAELVEDNDQASNYILGLHTIYQLKFDKLFEIFEKCVKNQEI